MRKDLMIITTQFGTTVICDNDFRLFSTFKLKLNMFSEHICYF